MNAVTLNLPLEDSATIGAAIYWLLALTGKCPTSHGTTHGTAVLISERALSDAALSQLAQEVGATTVAQLEHSTGQRTARTATDEAPWPETFYTISGGRLGASHD